MRSLGLGRKDLQKKMKEKIKGKGNLQGPAGMGATGTTETSTVGIAKTGAMGTAEKCAESAAGTGATSMAGVGIPTPAATLAPQKSLQARR